MKVIIIFLLISLSSCIITKPGTPIDHRRYYRTNTHKRYLDKYWDNYHQTHWQLEAHEIF